MPDSGSCRLESRWEAAQISPFRDPADAHCRDQHGGEPGPNPSASACLPTPVSSEWCPFQEIAAARLSKNPQVIVTVRCLCLLVAAFGILVNIAGYDLSNLWALLRPGQHHHGLLQRAPFCTRDSSTC